MLGSKQSRMENDANFGLTILLLLLSCIIKEHMDLEGQSPGIQKAKGALERNIECEK